MQISASRIGAGVNPLDVTEEEEEEEEEEKIDDFRLGGFDYIKIIFTFSQYK